MKEIASTLIVVALLIALLILGGYASVGMKCRTQQLEGATLTTCQYGILFHSQIDVLEEDE